METFSALLALCAGNSPVTGEFPSQRPVMRMMFSLICALNKRWSKQSWGWLFETPSCPLWRQCNGLPPQPVLHYLFHSQCILCSYWPALRAGLLCCNFFGQPGSVSKFPPLLWVKLWVGWVGRGYTEISRYFPASWINWVTLVTKIKLLYSLRF